MAVPYSVRLTRHAHDLDEDGHDVGAFTVDDTSYAEDGLRFSDGATTYIGEAAGDATDDASLSLTGHQGYIYAQTAGGADYAQVLVDGNTGNFEADVTGKHILGGGEGVVVPVLAADPGTGTDGQLYYNSASDTFRGYANGAWGSLGSGGGSSGFHYEVLMAAGTSPPEPLETGDGLDWLYVLVAD